MSTYGQVRMRLRKMVPPETDPDVLDGWISDRYTAILDRLPWKRSEKESVLQTVAPYVTGSVAVTNGGTSVVGTGTTFTSAMTGAAFQVAGDDAVYRFTYVSATSGTLDRAYEGSTSSEAGYSIFQNLLTLPSDARIIAEDGLSTFTGGPLAKVSVAELRRMSPNVSVSGTPQFWAPYMNDASNQMQAILFPYPDSVLSLQLTYVAELAVPASTGTSLLPWIRPAALIGGVLADAALAAKDFSAAAAYEALFEKRLADMVTVDTHNSPPETVHIAPRFTRHRAQRWNR